MEPFFSHYFPDESEMLTSSFVISAAVKKKKNPPPTCLTSLRLHGLKQQATYLTQEADGASQQTCGKSADLHLHLF